MTKNTVFLTILLVLLAVGTGFSLWKLQQYKPLALPKVQPAIDIGLPPEQAAAHQKIVEASSAVVWDSDNDRLLLEQNGFERRPIASLTKVMTAMIALDAGIDWNQRASINLNEYGPGGNLVLNPGEEVTMRDLFAASLLGSANNATKAYVRTLGIDTDEFVQRMNRKAIELGLEQTVFTDPTGLDPHNISTAYEVARMVEVAFTQYPDISKITAQPEYAFTVLNSNREHMIRNTNKLLADNKITATGSKTGYLDEARYCLVVQGTDAAKSHIVVVLGSPSQESNEAAVLSLLQRVFN